MNDTHRKGVHMERRLTASETHGHCSRRRLSAIVLVLALAAAVVGVASGALGRSPLQLQGRNVLTGTPVSLAADAGKPVVVNLWSSSCGACFADARALAAFEHSHPGARCSASTSPTRPQAHEASTSAPAGVIRASPTRAAASPPRCG